MLKKLVLKRISFSSYMKLTLICAVAFPLPICIIVSIGMLFGGPASLNGVQIPYPMSILYGMGFTLLIPVAYGLVFSVFALLMFPTFRLAMHIFKGIRIRAVVETIGDEDTNDSSQP